jgi:hypothetical protein
MLIIRTDPTKDVDEAEKILEMAFDKAKTNSIDPIGPDLLVGVDVASAILKTVKQKGGVGGVEAVSKGRKLYNRILSMINNKEPMSQVTVNPNHETFLKNAAEEHKKGEPEPTPDEEREFEKKISTSEIRKIFEGGIKPRPFIKEMLELDKQSAKLDQEIVEFNKKTAEPMEKAPDWLAKEVAELEKIPREKRTVAQQWQIEDFKHLYFNEPESSLGCLISLYGYECDKRELAKLFKIPESERTAAQNMNIEGYEQSIRYVDEGGGLSQEERRLAGMTMEQYEKERVLETEHQPKAQVEPENPREENGIKMSFKLSSEAEAMGWKVVSESNPIKEPEMGMT